MCRRRAAVPVCQISDWSQRRNFLLMPKVEMREKCGEVLAEKCKMPKRVCRACQRLERPIYWLVLTIVSNHCYANNSLWISFSLGQFITDSDDKHFHQFVIPKSIETGLSAFESVHKQVSGVCNLGNVKHEWLFNK